MTIESSANKDDDDNKRSLEPRNTTTNDQAITSGVQPTMCAFSSMAYNDLSSQGAMIVRTVIPINLFMSDDPIGFPVFPILLVDAIIIIFVISIRHLKRVQFPID